MGDHVGELTRSAVAVHPGGQGLDLGQVLPVIGQGVQLHELGEHRQPSQGGHQGFGKGHGGEGGQPRRQAERQGKQPQPDLEGGAAG